jgi:UDPglucose 6-dehydrogenase
MADMPTQQLRKVRSKPTIVVVGIGYVGLSNAILLAQHNTVIAIDTDTQRVAALNNRQAFITDPEIEDYLANKPLNLHAQATNFAAAYAQADSIIIATPTNYDDVTEQFDTSSVESVLRAATTANPTALIVIKSTVPVGFTVRMRQRYANQNIVFSPEFLREGRALYDNLHPSRIIIGDASAAASQFADLLVQGAIDDDIPVLHMSSTEAEGVKLFANTYLAMRVAFFNELDTYAELKGLDSRNLIRGISLDPRIGDYYNNPSFGYGGYCLPKDTKQLLSNYHNVPNDIITAVVAANTTRIQHVITMIMARKPRTVGVYRLTMKTGSDNFRQSSIRAVIAALESRDITIIVYEPTVGTPDFEGLLVVNKLTDFINQADIIIANRKTDELAHVASKLYTRDLFSRD